jgi:hypothetical protein
METKKTSKKSLKIAEIAVAPLAAPEAPVSASKPAKRAKAASSKTTGKVTGKSAATPKNSSHRHSKNSPTPAASINYDEVARLAYKYWEERNYAHGFAEEDWHRAEKAIRARS